MTPRVLRGLGLAAVWLVVALASGAAIFLGSSREVVLASHDSLVRPTLDGWVVISTGPVLPDVRIDSGTPVGVDITLGKTTAESPEELVERYAFIAGQPEGSVAKVRSAVADMAYDAAVRGMLIGLLPVVVWLLLGPERRSQLWRGARSRTGIAAGLAVVVAVVLLWEPWQPDEPSVRAEQTWEDLEEFLDGQVDLPASVPLVQVRSDVTVVESKRLVLSALSTYENSKEFYDKAAAGAAELPLREPSEDETVVVLVSDRHDNIGMDRVARAIGDRAGAEAVFDAGDDTSTGGEWEAFSLDSLTTAFEDLDRYAVAGNHDSGSFVRDYLDDLGWDMLDGTVVDGPGDAPLIGIDDPRSSGLGNWRDETGPQLRGGRRPVQRRDLRRRRAGLDRAGPRHRPGAARARARLRRPRRRRPRPRQDRAGPGRGPGRGGRLQLHDRHDRRRGVRHRHRVEAAPRRDGLADHLPRRPPRRHPAGDAADQRAVRREQLHPAVLRAARGARRHLAEPAAAGRSRRPGHELGWRT